MRPLILSFFAVILIYSLFFDKKTEEVNRTQSENFVLMDNKVPAADSIDTILIFKDKTAFAVR